MSGTTSGEVIWLGLTGSTFCAVGFAAAALWAVVKYLAPAYRMHEDDVSLALLVERRQGLNSDLVAALQFADDGREQTDLGHQRHPSHYSRPPL